MESTVKIQERNRKVGNCWAGCEGLWEWDWMGLIKKELIKKRTDKKEN